MFDLSNVHHFRKTMAGACMVVAPLLVLIASVVRPGADLEAGGQIAVAAGAPDAFYVAQLLLLLGLVLALPAVLGLMHMLREREAAHGHVGGGFSLLGILGFVLAVGISFVVWQMAAPGADRLEMTGLLERVLGAPGVTVPLYVAVIASALGAIVLALGLYRARAVHPWMAAFYAIGGVLLPIAFASASVVLAIVGAAALFVGLGSIGRLVLTESDADWEHTTEVKGIRPLAGTR